ncbi:MAG: acyltransferase [Verrucomicrobiaceae bacterium]|nr:acyltransferase [Verrucomicrobiaceae bacterium]
MNRAPGGHLSGLEMMRGLAALAVVCHHIAQQLVGNPLAGSAGGRLLLWLGGWGVIVFFVLSGFCIHGSVLKQSTTTAIEPDWRTYFARRARRILPGYFAALGLSLVAGSMASTALISAPTTAGVLTHLTFTSGFTHDTALQINCVLWTVVVEVQFYALYPLFIGLRNRLGIAGFTLLLVSISMAIKLAGRSWFDAEERWTWHHLFLNLWWVWALGAWLAEVHAGRSRAWLGLRWLKNTPVAVAVIIASLVLGMVDGQRWHTLWLVVESYALPVLATGVVGAMVFSPLGQGRVPVMEALGRWSYSLYLFHPLALWGCWQLAEQRASAKLVVAMLVSSGLLAALGYRLVERPFQARRAT